MARRRQNKSKKRKSTPLLLIGALVVVILAIFLCKPKGGSPARLSSFSISEYREKGGSSFIGNHYTFEGKVENIISRGNDRLVSISLKSDPGERLPLLVKDGDHVNLSRGDTFVFQVECCTGKDENGVPVKGVFVVKDVTIK